MIGRAVKGVLSALEKRCGELDLELSDRSQCLSALTDALDSLAEKTLSSSSTNDNNEATEGKIKGDEEEDEADLSAARSHLLENEDRLSKYRYKHLILVYLMCLI